MPATYFPDSHTRPLDLLAGGPGQSGASIEEGTVHFRNAQHPLAFRTENATAVPWVIAYRNEEAGRIAPCTVERFASVRGR